MGILSVGDSSYYTGNLKEDLLAEFQHDSVDKESIDDVLFAASKRYELKDCHWSQHTSEYRKTSYGIC